MESNAYTLKEIRGLKSKWYSEGRENFDRIARVVRECGDRVEHACRNYSIFTTGEITVQLLDSAGPWDPAKETFHKRRRMVVSIGKIRSEIDPRKPRETTIGIVDASTFDPGRDGIDIENLFFRPGKWVENVLAFEPIAIERERARAVEAEMIERDRIFNQLSLNREV